ncbi:MAG: zinc ribbon domain-containing protein [Bacilli bacterium]
MYCHKCGKQIPDDAKFCPYCGEDVSNDNKKEDDIYPVSDEHPYVNNNDANSNVFNNEKNKSANNYSVSGFIFSFIFPILGLIFSIVEISKSKKEGSKASGFAIAGIIISSIVIFLYLIGILSRISQ